MDHTFKPMTRLSENSILPIIKGTFCTAYTRVLCPWGEEHIPGSVPTSRGPLGSSHEAFRPFPGNGNLEAGKPHEGPIEGPIEGARVRDILQTLAEWLGRTYIPSGRTPTEIDEVLATYGRLHRAIWSKDKSGGWVSN